jgi:hypothetical protein
VFLVRYELGFYVPEDGILHSERRDTLGYYMPDIALQLPTALRILTLCSISCRP